jgi:glycosyltransferase involved in cell wall biosynthesis
VAKLSVLIPSRNEKYLFPTIRDCFAKSGGDTEVVVTLDGYWPEGWKEMTETYSNLHTVHHGEARGLRPAINSGAASAISRGAEYLFKLDAHCLLDEGFDIKLLADIEPNWIVVPRRKRLDPDAWAVTETHKPDIDYHYLSFPDDPSDFGGPGLNGKVWEERARERRDKPEFDIDDELSSQGSAWCMASSYFQFLELMDTESYGPFWNEAQELFLKCWLSGGRGVINKKTFYAHLHKGTKHGRGYRLPEQWLQQGASYTKRWIYNDAWAKQTLPFEWLIDHFWPVPGWAEDWREVLYATRKPRMVGTVVTVSDNSGDAGATDSDIRNPAEKVDGQGVKADDYAAGGLVIHYAYYGDGTGYVDKSVDVTERVRSLVVNDSLDIIINNSTLTPGQNPFRGQKKKLTLAYSYADGKSDGEQVVVTRDEKDWLIIGQAQRDIGSKETAEIIANRDSRAQNVQPAYTVRESISGVCEETVRVSEAAPTINATLDVFQDATKQAMEIMTHGSQPLSATALNDYLIRKFSISPHRLRAPMPIELRGFHRDDLAQLFAELGFTKGCEVGVAEGRYSEVLLKANPKLELHMVDPWHGYSDNPQNKSKGKHEFAYRETLRRTRDYKMAIPVMQESMEYVRQVVDESLDFCYIDGNHQFNYVLPDIIEWSKRVRSGGIIALDDYYELDPKRWGAGVVEAVQAYVNAHKIRLWWMCSGHKSVDVFWVKP